MRSRDPRRAAAMFLEASVAHMMTGDLDALIASAERARALSAGAEPAVELLATARDRRGPDRARARSSRASAELRACEPYLMEADPLGDRRDRRDGRRTPGSGSRTGTRASRMLTRVLGAARAASAVTALIHPLAVQAHLDLRRGRWAPALAGASEAAELAEDTGQLALLPHALAALTLVEAGPRPRDRLPRATSRAGSSCWRERRLPARRARRARARARPHPRGDRGARDRRAPDAAPRPELGGRRSCAPT